jgi:hypothetical protein
MTGSVAGEWPTRFRLGSESPDDGSHEDESTANQWPASIAVTNGFMPSKAWLVATVVSTKPIHRKTALTTPPLMVTSERWPIRPASIQAIRKHETAAMIKGVGECRALSHSSLLLPRADIQTLPKTVYQPQPRRNAATAATTTAR